MTAVNIREGVRYGISLLGYFIALFLAGGITLGIGFVLFTLDNIVATLIGFIILLGGLVIVYAGSLGVAYKVIADGVEKGVRSLHSSDSAGPESTTTEEGLVGMITGESGNSDDR